MFLWAQLEIQLGIVCATAPSLRVFFRRFLSNNSLSRKLGSRMSSGQSERGRSLAQGSIKISSTEGDRPIIALRSMSVEVAKRVTFLAKGKSDKKPLDKAGQSASDEQGCSPTSSNKKLTRYTHEDQPVALQQIEDKMPDAYEEVTARPQDCTCDVTSWSEAL